MSRIANLEPDQRKPSLAWWALILGLGLVSMLLSMRSRLSPHAPDAARETRLRPNAETFALTGPGRHAREALAGQAADSPAEIPAQGWKHILGRTWQGLGEDRILLVAAGITFYALLSLFPALAALVSLYGLFADPANVGGRLDSLASFLPSGALDLIGSEIGRIAGEAHHALGAAFFISLAVSLWTANSGMKGLIEGMNVVYEEKEKRGFIGLNLLSLAFTLAAIAFILLALGAMVVAPLLLGDIGLGGSGDALLSLLRWPLLLLVALFALAVLYRFGPSRRAPRWRWVTWGSALAAFLWLGGSVLFSWYVANFGKYNATYGSLGAAVGLMTWLWLSVIVVLLGGELNSKIERQSGRDASATASGAK
ncbi:YihY/virulence factor BrkB family protein [Methylocella tundrae]|uniref:Membrane protein n=1 Tax=Methylocella tundrae TaxID=227605 RepID=A0A4U8Z3K4_METTU|nr:YihY/virulence factor BrkB family protein [Methylocella tundrae]WPP03824.1 YihY/virulence factor BrkB family protein [Methylocella tundrae]VFU10004.1 Membrane protein [Methylocella tundrae]